MPGRLIGTAIVAAPLFATHRIRAPRSVVPFVVLTGIVEVVGFVSFTVGAHADIAIAAVLASMFAPIAAAAAFVLLHGRLAPRQLFRIAMVVVGIAVLGVLAAV